MMRKESVMQTIPLHHTKREMTDKMKAFLESISGDEAFLGKVKKASTSEEIRALAAEKGITLNDEDLNGKAAVSELSDDEMEAVNGGTVCFCDGGGGGEVSGEGDKLCVCAIVGVGLDNHGDSRCLCIGGGGGAASDY